MTYVLEHDREFERLEHQSTLPKYDYKKELRDFEFPSDGTVLDAGCGSGVVARYLAGQHRTAKIIGCDYSKDRVAQAAKAASALSNVTFEAGDLRALRFKNNFFDGAVCRYVLEHLLPQDRLAAVKEILRCLKPGGEFCAIDFDGVLHNLYPQPTIVSEVLTLVDKAQAVDLNVGRKIASLLTEAGFENIRWRIETIECTGTTLQTEAELLAVKFQTTTEFLSRLLQSQEKALEFNRAYLEAMRKPGAVLFYNKFVVLGKKSAARNLKLVS